MLLRRALGILGRSSRIIQLDPQGCRGAACVAVLVVPRAQVYVVQLLRSGQQRPIHGAVRKHDGDLLRGRGGSVIWSREFAMGNPETFSLAPVAKLLDRWLGEEMVIVDPFARNSDRGTITNDLNPTTCAEYHMLAE